MREGQIQVEGLFSWLGMFRGEMYVDPVVMLTPGINIGDFTPAGASRRDDKML
jgi:hypothetical protein